MRLLSFLLFICFAIIVNAQSNSPTKTIDRRLTEAFEKSYLQRIQYKNPALLQRWTFYLDHSYYVTPYIAKKFNDSVPSIQVKDLSSINIFQLEKANKHLKRDWNKPMAYRISGTNKMLVYYAGKDFIEDFNAWRAGLEK